MVRFLIALSLIFTSWNGQALAQGLPPTVDEIFSSPAIQSPQLSPDGTKLLFVRRPQAEDEDQSKSIIFVIDYTDMDSPVVNQLQVDADGLQWAIWGNNERILLSWRILTEVEGFGAFVRNFDDELTVVTQVWRSLLLSMNLDGSDVVSLVDQSRRRRLSLNQTRLDRIVDPLSNDPEHILLQVRSRNGGLNVNRVNIYTGEDRTITRGRDLTLAYFTNSEGDAVMRIDAMPRLDRIALLVRDRNGRVWRRVATQNIGNFTEFKDGIYWVARAESFDEALVFARAEGSDTLGLHLYSLTDSGLIEPIFEHENYDIESVTVDPITGRALGVSWADSRSYFEVFDPLIDQHLTALRDFFGEDVLVQPIQRAGRRILIRISGPSEPRVYYLYDTESFNIIPIGPRQTGLQSSALATVKIHTYTASDGTELFGYLTIPARPMSNAMPLVVLPHGGPEARDYLEFDPLAQLIAGQGMMVFQPQFRGSSGFGADFAEAGHGEWGGLIQRDITEGVRSVIALEDVDADRICVAGWSFGGYSALMQSILEPDLYSCVAAGAPVTDLASLLLWEEGEDGEPNERLRSMLGFPDADLMLAHSPARRAAELTTPLLLVHGIDDRIVPIRQSRLLATFMEQEGLEPEFVEFEGGHALNNREEMSAAMTTILEFLDHHIGSQSPPE